MVTLAQSSDKDAKSMFDKTGKNYIDLILDFFDNAKSGSVSVDDVKDLEVRFQKLQERIKEAEDNMVEIENLQVKLYQQLSDKTIKQFADGVQRYFKQSGYLDHLQTDISNIYMARWINYIVQYCEQHHIPLVKLDIEKVAKQVAEYIMGHCEVYRRTNKCPYIKDEHIEVECHKDCSNCH